MNKRWTQTTLLVLGMLISGIVQTESAQAQLPTWDPDPVCGSIVTDGVAAFTCGVTTAVPQDERFVLGMMQIIDVVPDAGRLNITNSIEIFHHPSWNVDVIGNVFGVIMDDCGNTYVTASSSYAADFFNVTSILKYGTLAGADDSLESAGAIYKIDAATGQAEHFVSLPQQVSTFTHPSCEFFGSSVSRTTGPGLGNITFDPRNRLFYVTNFEDGRIYRLDMDGNILDSYDPFANDNLVAGAVSLEEITFGVVISPDGSRMFFGTAEHSPNGNVTAKRIFSTALNQDGSFAANVDNSSLPPGATWSNFAGTEQLEFTAQANGNTGLFNLPGVFSDLEFLPSGQLMAGARAFCENSIHSGYNHNEVAYVLEDTGLGFLEIGQLRTGDTGDPEHYGGVSWYQNAKGEVDYVVTSADMLSEQGPHGIHVSDEGNFPLFGPISPAAAISYSSITSSTDTKGIGGDVHVFRRCQCDTCLCLGDINRDGTIDLLDVAPFVDVLTGGLFDACADINQDGVVDLLDVNPFVDLILSGAGCDTCLCLGDINRDGNVDLIDVQPFVDVITSGDSDPCADINQDGVVDLLDVAPFVDLITSGAGCGNGLLPPGTPSVLDD